MSKVNFCLPAETVALFSVCAARYVFVVHFTFFAGTLSFGKGLLSLRYPFGIPIVSAPDFSEPGIMPSSGRFRSSRPAVSSVLPRGGFSERSGDTGGGVSPAEEEESICSLLSAHYHQKTMIQKTSVFCDIYFFTSSVSNFRLQR